MKKLAPFLLIALSVMLIFSSCKKDYSCKCTIADWSSTGGDTTIEIPLQRMTKVDAKFQCDQMAASYKIYGSGVDCGFR